MQNFANPRVLGPYFRKKRIERGFTQLELAQSLGYQNSQIVSNWERGTSEPPTKIIRKLVLILAVNETEVLDILMTHHRQYWESQLKVIKKKAK